MRVWSKLYHLVVKGAPIWALTATTAMGSFWNQELIPLATVVSSFGNLGLQEAQVVPSDVANQYFEIHPEAYATQQALFETYVGEEFKYDTRAPGYPPLLASMSKDEALAQLANTNLVFIVDRSGSTRKADTPPMAARMYHTMLSDNLDFSRYDSEFAIAKMLGETAYRVDTNGIPFISFGNTVKEVQTRNPNDLLNAFRAYAPSNEATNLHDALKHAFKKYAKKDDVESGKRTLFVVITDGEPSNFSKNPRKQQDPTWAFQKIRKTIYKHLVKKDPHGDFLNLLFIRVGDDPKAITFLKWLDEIGRAHV